MKLTDQQKIDIVSKYLTGNYSCSSLAREYNVTAYAITKILRVRNIPINNNLSKILRKFDFDENYFDEINTEGKAYFLGLLFADGNNLRHRNRISIQLQEEDGYILNSFREELKTNKPLQLRKFNKSNLKNQYLFSIQSPYLSSLLNDLGMVAKKSEFLTIPKPNIIPKYLIRHFIRGYFDGNGHLSISSTNPNTVKFGIVSTKIFCEYLHDVILQELNIDAYLCLKNKNNDITTSLQITGLYQVLKITNWLYTDSSFSLERKYNKYIQLLKVKKSRSSASQLIKDIIQYEKNKV